MAKLRCIAPLAEACYKLCCPIEGEAGGRQSLIGTATPLNQRKYTMASISLVEIFMS